MATKTRTLESTAYHEAGHAVAAFHHDIRIRRVSIVARDESLGHCATFTSASFNPEIDLDRAGRDRLERELIVLFAGPAAEARYLGRNNWRCAGSDLHASTNLLLYHHANERVQQAYLKYVREYVSAFIGADQVWLDVTAVAEALLGRSKLSGRETVEIIRQSRAQKMYKAASPRKPR